MSSRIGETTLESASIKQLIIQLSYNVLTHKYTLKSALLMLIILSLYRSSWKTKSFKGKNVVLTGAATGLGRAQAFSLAKEGCAKVILWDINIEQLEKTAQEVRNEYPNCETHAYAINLANREAIYALADKVIKQHGFIWCLINNAGIISGSYLLDTPDKKIELTMAVNVMAHFWTIKAFLPQMIERNDGHIVGVASAAGFFPSAKMMDYCASKFACRGLLESLRLELNSLGKNGVGCTLVAPAHINTDLFKGYSLGSTMQPQWVAEQIINAVKINRFLQFLPQFPLVMGNLWQGVFPTPIWDIFMLPTNSQLNNWQPAQSNKIFDKMTTS